jgi:hypothetical protein
MSEGNVTFIVIMLTIAATICFCVNKGCNYEEQRRADFINNGYEYKQVPYSYSYEWVKPENKEKQK